MDGLRFDILVRSWGTPTRRGTLRLAVGALAMLLPGGDVAAAKCKKLGKKCNRRRGDRCCDDGTCRGGRCQCPGGAVAIRGACFFRGACAPNAPVCDGECGDAPSGGDHDGCYCGTTVDNQTLCFKNTSLCSRLCQTTADCPKGLACFATSCEEEGGPGTCFKPCRRRFLA